MQMIMPSLEINVPYSFQFWSGFHEDERPPYHGTWSKPRSTLVSGRRPFGKDTQYLDYDVESEDEWENGDDEEGEDVDDAGADEEEEVQNEEEDNDGWLAADDDTGIEDEDEETRELRKKSLNSGASSSSTQATHFKACVVAPRMGGLPHENCSDDMESIIEGFNPQDAMNTLASHVGHVLIPSVNICLDAFPPVERTDGSDQAKKEATGKSPNAQNDPKNSLSQEMSKEAAKIMAQFIHNSTLNSREKLVTELRVIFQQRGGRSASFLQCHQWCF